MRIDIKKVNAINNKFDMRPREKEKSLSRRSFACSCSFGALHENMKYSLVHQRLPLFNFYVCAIRLGSCVHDHRHTASQSDRAGWRERERGRRPVPNTNVKCVRKKMLQIQNCM